MVAGVTLMARQVDRPVDGDRQVGVYLDEALVVALIPVVSAPRFVFDVLDPELLTGRKLHVPQSARLAFRQCSPENRVEFRGRNDELPAIALVPLAHGSIAGKQCAQ